MEAEREGTIPSLKLLRYLPPPPSVVTNVSCHPENELPGYHHGNLSALAVAAALSDNMKSAHCRVPYFYVAHRSVTWYEYARHARGTILVMDTNSHLGFRWVATWGKARYYKEGGGLSTRKINACSMLYPTEMPIHLSPPLVAYARGAPKHIVGVHGALYALSFAEERVSRYV